MTARPYPGPLYEPEHGPLWAHGIVRREFRPRPGLTGVGGGAVVAVPEGPVAALVSVPYGAHGPCEGPDASRASPADACAQAAADAHRRVVDEAAATVCVLPLRLGTVHRDEAEVHRMLAARADLYERLLTRLDGRLEWGVKAYADAAGDGAAGSGARGGAGGSGGSGEGTEGLARAAHHALADVSECSRVHPPREAGAASVAAACAYWTSPISAAPYPHGRNVLDSAYLVPREAAGAFAETVGGVVARCPELHIELTGPWAPYSFTEPGRLPDLPA